MGRVKDLLFDNEIGNLPPEAHDPFDTDGPFDPQDGWLKTADDEDKKTAMREWFLARFCDPANDTPYNGREGGYLFIHGGPFDPEDELFTRFSGLVADDLIQELADDLIGETGHDWAPILYGPADDYYDERFELNSESNDTPLDRLKERLAHASQILDLQGDPATIAVAEKLVFSSAITALESFLWETVEYWVENDELTLRNIVTNIGAIRDEPIKLGDIYTRHDGLKAHVKGYLQSLVWHRWDQVVPLLKKGLEINPPSFKPFVETLVKRHDIVHRSGVNKEGQPISVTRADIQALCDQTIACAEDIHNQLAKKKPPATLDDLSVSDDF